MDHPFQFRPHTCDHGVFHDINVNNEYRLPPAFAPEDIIVDVGTHIGSFCYAALARGSNHVYGFEAFVENYECARRNLASFGDRVRLRNAAVWRSDRKTDQLFFNPLDLEPENTGAGHVLVSGRGREIEVLAFDDIIHEVTDGGKKRVKLVKLDCEGSEFPILLTSRTLHLIDTIIGEYHNYKAEHDPRHPFHHIPENATVAGYTRYTIDELSGALRQAGFDVTTIQHPTHPEFAGWFFARRPAQSRLLAGLHFLRCKVVGSGAVH